MTIAKFEEFVRLPNFFYKTIGIEPYEKPGVTKRKSLLRQLVFFAWSLNVILALNGEVFFVLFAFAEKSDILEAIMTMSYIAFVGIGWFKMTTIWLKKHKLTQFMLELYQIYPQTEATQRIYKLKNYLRSCNLTTVSFSVLYLVLITVYSLFAIAEYLIYERWLQIRIVGLTLPYSMYIPWNYHDNWSYYVIYIAQYSVAYCTAVGQISADLLLCVAATQLLMHYDYIANCIETYRIKSKRVTDGVKHDMEFLRNIIIYHEKLLSLSDMLNDVFGVPLLVNFMSSACLMCFLGFQLTTGVSTEILLKLLLFLFSSSAQAYLICYFGQKLLEASIGISNAVYIHNWFEADLQYKKMLIQMARRAQRPAVLKATVLINISNVTMTDLLQISYKFFALLRTMYA